MPAFEDERGWFIKSFQDTFFEEKNIRFELRESYFSISRKNVIRGMHFQLPPFQHHKIVFCPQGAILDVMLDLRKDSPSFGRHFAIELSAQNHQAVFIPEGFAHGFLALTDNAMTYYLVSSSYRKEYDTGIRWDSFGMSWPATAPLISARDQSFAPLAGFQTPF